MCLKVLTEYIYSTWRLHGCLKLKYICIWQMLWWHLLLSTHCNDREYNCVGIGLFDKSYSFVCSIISYLAFVPHTILSSLYVPFAFISSLSLFSTPDEITAHGVSIGVWLNSKLISAIHFCGRSIHKTINQYSHITHIQISPIWTQKLQVRKPKQQRFRIIANTFKWYTLMHVHVSYLGVHLMGVYAFVYRINFMKFSFGIVKYVTH